MEELQDAIEDAQYVSAISSVEDGPRPVLPWDIPDDADVYDNHGNIISEGLVTWKEVVLTKHAKEEDSDKGAEKKLPPKPFDFEWTLAHALGFFLFSAYLKESAKDHVEINFMEEVIRWKGTRGRLRAEKTSFIVNNYLSPLSESDAAANKKAAANAITANANATNNDEPNPAEQDENGGERTASTTTTATTNDGGEGDNAATADDDTNNNGEKAAETTAASSAIPMPTPLAGPPITDINEHDLAREPTTFSAEEIQEMRTNSDDPTKTCIGVGGQVLESILTRVDKLRNAPGFASLSEGVSSSRDDNDNDTGNNNNGKSSEEQSEEKKEERKRSIRNMSIVSNELPEDLFDRAEVIVAENVHEKHWAGFQSSKYHAKLLNFLWFQDRKVVEEDFFVMRVLGRGGFGLVTACKKGTSGKLYAMKVMNKKRIKIKKAEQLTLNEQICLADVNSPFVVNLKYSFQSDTDVFLILDLMTGGDLSYHLSQKGCFPKKECLYYGARIMLGLQALHDKGYVYRDLKPENCLLGEDGRVKLTDLGLATKVTPKLHGAAGTRGYWAPEMLRRDEQGKRKNYDHMVDWFSFGCCLAEFISGTNPFRSEVALNYGLDKGKKTKEKAIDYATLEMHPEFDSEKFTENAADICRRLLDKSEATRLGVNGCNEIMSHPWFRNVNWEEIITDRMKPPYIPPKDVNAASQSEIGTFAEDKTFHDTVLSEKDEAVYEKWNFTNSKAFAAEVIEFLIYERETGQPLLPIQPNAGCCCTVL